MTQIWELTTRNFTGCSRNFEMPVTCGSEVCFTSIQERGAYFRDRHSPASVRHKHFMIPYSLKR